MIPVEPNCYCTMNLPTTLAPLAASSKAYSLPRPESCHTHFVLYTRTQQLQLIIVLIYLLQLQLQVQPFHQSVADLP